ncbi:ribonuclease HI [Pseudovibrio ascidiaceicola]|uniref:ribonuclease HI n=1 Tax=Pseudovibrio ascidiaceicola TaxID=285279 RepID=UPI003D369B19
MTEETRPQITIYTDGSCSPNPGPGGWGAILSNGKREKEIKGGEADTTNSRMEMEAIIQALSALRRPSNVTLHTDSQFIVNSATKWLEGWKNKNFKGVKNVDLWERLLPLMKRHEITWKWVKGHAGNPKNERADGLANRGREETVAKSFDAF